MWKAPFELLQGVFRIDWSSAAAAQDCDGPAMTQWFVPSYVNQRSWCIALMQLALDSDPEAAAVATALGHTALRACYLPFDAETMCPFEAMCIDVFPRQFLGIDLEMTASLS